MLNHRLPIHSASPEPHQILEFDLSPIQKMIIKLIITIKSIIFKKIKHNITTIFISQMLMIVSKQYS